MKRSVIVLCLLALLVQGHAQKKRTRRSARAEAVTCASLPYRPTFGVIGDTAADVQQWRFSISNSGRWRFQSIPDSNIIVPFFVNSEPYAVSGRRTSTIFSQCLSLDSTKKYELKFTFVGNKVGTTHNLKIYWASIADNYGDNETFLIGTCTAAPYGTTSYAFIVDSIPAATGDFRIAFKGDEIDGNSSFYLKDIVLEEIPVHQLALTELSSPMSKCDLSNQTLSFKIKNSGYTSPPTYNVCYQYSDDNGPFGAPICESFTTNIPYQAIQEVSFTATQTFNSSVTTINAWVSYSGQTTFDTLKNVLIHKTPPHQVPYTCSFDDISIYKDWLVIPKTTQSNVTWNVPLNNNGALGGKAVIVTNSVASDDRLVTGCITLEQDVLYKISFEYNAYSSTDFENLSLYVGTSNSPQNSDITLMNLQGFNNADPRTISTYFKPTSSGPYFFGFLAYSNASSGGIAISNFAIETTTPITVPVYMGFENYDESEEWQTLSYNSIANGWQATSTNGEFYSGSVGLKTFAKEAPDTNNNWLISKPLSLTAGKTYEILYFRRALSSLTEVLNVRVDTRPDVQALSLSMPLFSDTVKNSAYQPQKVYFTPSQTGVHFVTFQYNVTGHSGSPAPGLCLDDITIRDSVMAVDTNLSVVALTIPDPSCTLANNETVTLTIKNRSGYTIPSGKFKVYFMRNGDTLPARNNVTVSAYQSVTVSTGINMSDVNSYEIKAWISGDIDKDKSDDTSSIKQTQKIQAINVREDAYTMGFELDEKRILWNTSIGSANYQWSITDNAPLAHTGTGLAYLAPTAVFLDSLRQYMGSPCLSLRPLSSNTTYFISFLYRAAATNMVNATTVNIYAGSSNSNLVSQLKKSLLATNSAYERTSIYYRPENNRPQYVGIEGISKREAGGLCVDDFVIMDSVSASLPDLYMNQIWVATGDNCSLSADTVYVEIQNKGFFAYENPSFKITFGGETYVENFTGTLLPPDTSMVFKLRTLFQHSAFGTDSVLVSLNIPSNRAKTDTSLSATSAKYSPAELPYSVTFTNSEILPWNNLVEPYDYARSKTFDYWTFNTADSETYAFFDNGSLRNKPGLLVSGCISMKADEPYRLTYRYKTVNTYSPENLSIMRDKIDGTVETLANYSDLTNTTTYASNSVAFNGSGNGSERIRFFSNYNLLAQGIYINYISVTPDTSKWPVDAKLIEIMSPNSEIVDAATTEPVSVRVTNINRRPLRNIPIFYTLDDVLYVDTIPVLNPGDTIPFTFIQTADLSTLKTYELVTFIGANDDVNPSNDTLRRTVTSTPIQSIHNPSVPLTIYPNPATTEVFIKSAKEISTLHIYDLRGQLLSKIRVNNTEFHLNIGDFPSGLYMFSCQIGNERVSQRVVIKNNQP